MQLLGIFQRNGPRFCTTELLYQGQNHHHNEAFPSNSPVQCSCDPGLAMDDNGEDTFWMLPVVAFSRFFGRKHWDKFGAWRLRVNFPKSRGYRLHQSTTWSETWVAEPSLVYWTCFFHLFFPVVLELHVWLKVVVLFPRPLVEEKAPRSWTIWMCRAGDAVHPGHPIYPQQILSYWNKS